MASPPPEPSLLAEVAKYAATALISGIASYAFGRASKNKEFLSSDLSDRAKEFRELVASIEKSAVEYWRQDQSAPSALIGDDLQSSLHRMQGLRTYCETVCAGFGSAQIRKLEDQYWEAVTGGDFQGSGRKAESDRAILIRSIANDLTMVSLRARRADLFLRRPKD